MNIDRKRFFFLAATLSATSAAIATAASGCTINTTNNSTDGGGTPSTTPTDTDSGNGSVDTDAGGGSSGSCLADKTPAPSCEGIDGGTAAKCAQCESYNALFKGEVAAAIRTCLDQATTCEANTTSCAEHALAQGCDDPTATTVCQTALACAGGGGSSGIDGGYDGGPDPMADCVNVVRSLSAGGRNEFQSCLDDYGGACAPGTLHDCITGTLDPVANPGP